MKQIHADDTMDLNSSLPSPSLSFSSSSSTNMFSVYYKLSSTSITIGTITSAIASSSQPNVNRKSTAMEIFLNIIADNVVPNSTTSSHATIIEGLYKYRLLVDKYNIQISRSTSSCLTF